MSVALLLQGQESHSVKKLSLYNYIDELSSKTEVPLARLRNHQFIADVTCSTCMCAECCPPDATRRCIIIDNIEYVSMHTDMAGLVRGVSEWSGAILPFFGDCVGNTSKQAVLVAQLQCRLPNQRTICAGQQCVLGAWDVRQSSTNNGCFSV